MWRKTRARVRVRVRARPGWRNSICFPIRKTHYLATFGQFATSGTDTDADAGTGFSPHRAIRHNRYSPDKSCAFPQNILG